MKQIKTLLGSVVCIAGTLAFTTATTQAQPLVDPSFEAEGAANAWDQLNPIPVPGGVGGGWAEWGASLSSAAAHSGIYSALIWDNTWNPQGLYQMLPASPGQTFNLDAWYMSPNPSACGYATPVLVQISFFDSTGTGIPGGVFGPWLTLGAAGVWEDSPVVTATAPAGTAYIGAYLMMMDSSGANGFDLYVDDATLTVEVVPEPSSLALVGLGLMSALVWRRRQ